MQYCDLFEEYRKGSFTNYKELYDFVKKNHGKYKGNMLQRWYDEDFSRLRQDGNSRDYLKEFDGVYSMDEIFEVDIFSYRYFGSKKRLRSIEEVAEYVKSRHVKDGCADVELRNAMLGYGIYHMQLGMLIEYVYEKIFEDIFDTIKWFCQYPPCVRSFEGNHGEKPGIVNYTVINVVQDSVVKYFKKEISIEDLLKVLVDQGNTKFIRKYVCNAWVFGASKKESYLGEKNRGIIVDFLNLNGDMPVKESGKYKGCGDLKAIAEKYNLSDVSVRSKIKKCLDIVIHDIYNECYGKLLV